MSDDPGGRATIGHRKMIDRSDAVPVRGSASVDASLADIGALEKTDVEHRITD
jgi:hypothetical protein